ncbi:spore coat protein [Clostridium sp. D2Q-11]|uniref:Spore coat protein n=1 Tax=Anaeromonas frigoriresistens TaxID=2683708 RepID=A0A942UV55_9FIRM|nr:spore coat protein [Anaeromonas frigoriresistens]MBS4538075.1 spore coat protein [Anaeromonas frigoriresistens]
MILSRDLTEKDILQDLILSEKQLSHSYNNSIMDINCPVLRDTFINCQINIQWSQYLLKDAIDRRNWEKVNLVSQIEKEILVNKYLSPNTMDVY